jgi:prepilin-type N-terminal cleavage/methylation domain-containing protein
MPPACPSHPRARPAFTAAPSPLARALVQPWRVSGGQPTRRAEVRAFTFVELLTVAAIMAILSTIAIGAIAGVKQRAAIGRAKSELAALTNALEDYKRYYGDYPQLGDFNQAPATPANVANGPGTTTAQAKLFNCLTGVFGPTKFSSADRVNGPNFLSPQFMDTPSATATAPAVHVHLAGTVANTFLIPAAPSRGAPPTKIEQNVGLIDPWGRYYLYYYKRATNPAAWQATGYVLYSAGPRVATNGTQTPSITPTTGLLLTTQSGEMADNIYANQ